MTCWPGLRWDKDDCPDCGSRLSLTPATNEPFCTKCRPMEKKTVEFDEGVMAYKFKMPGNIELTVWPPLQPGAPTVVHYGRGPLPRGEYPSSGKLEAFFPEDV